MKIRLLTTALAGFGLATLPLHAEDATTNKVEKSPSSESATKTIPTYLVVFSGGG